MKKKKAQLFKRSTKQKKPSNLNSSEASMILNLNSNSPKVIIPKTKSQIPIPQSPLTTISTFLQNSKILTQSFFQIDALDLAPRLLGKFLRRDDVVLQITEVEAYRPNDTACHGRFGITARTAPVFGPGGNAYVYLCYGLHTMLNIVADKQGVGAAVLVRACAPVSGLETIQQRRRQMTEKPVLLAGPGKVGQALGISTEWSNHPLYTPGGLEVLDGPEPEKILVGPRVGIEYASPEDIRASFDKECKICIRPFTVCRWKPGQNARYKKTQICQTCSKLKNVCQVCILDLTYGLPVQARDTAMATGSNEFIPRSDVNREYFYNVYERRNEIGVDCDSSFGKARSNDTMLKLQRTTPYYKRNNAHVCSFYVRGVCKRGSECPYRHEMPITGELSKQNIKDRYFGNNDPVASKLLNMAGEMSSLIPPEDENIKTLYVSEIKNAITEQDLRDHFNAYGEVTSVKMVPRCSCAFVTYLTRAGAEKAAKEFTNILVIKGLKLKLSWSHGGWSRKANMPSIKI
ncbi:Pre-mrna-splicing factor rbm22 [Thalictrum thalictroides]|uniref:DNA-3-methyladenine glycosylase II n=1 Tax=Thalictrum thalictroides TaxID=46969 RepID=A0A7J6X448_THATH|nr:Pre-mrna-splicing factor rbm22 [Thalictrum thalictroides]